MKKTITIVAVLILVAIGIYFFVLKNRTVNNEIPNPLTNTEANGTIVSIKNFVFNPQTLKIKIGTKVTWVNNDSVSHTVTSDSDNILNSPVLSPGQSFSFTFTDSGSTNYHCTIHPAMKGLIIIYQ